MIHNASRNAYRDDNQQVTPNLSFYFVCVCRHVSIRGLRIPVSVPREKK